jgi:hypothetical protein
LAASTAAIIIAGPDGRTGAQIGWTLFYLPLFLVLFKMYGLYDGDRKRLGHSTLDDVQGVFMPRSWELSVSGAI